MIKSILFIISFLTILIYFFIAMQFVYAQTVENEIIENTLERVENATAGISGIITESLNNASESTEDGTTTSDISKQHNQDEYKIYESQIIGVKFKIPSTWDILLELNDTKDCFEGIYTNFRSLQYNSTFYNCMIILDNKASSFSDFDVEIREIIPSSPSSPPSPPSYPSI
jgi:uncharacterized protein (UPF0333 family)